MLAREATKDVLKRFELVLFDTFPLVAIRLVEKRLVLVALPKVAKVETKEFDHKFVAVAAVPVDLP